MSCCSLCCKNIIKLILGLQSHKSLSNTSSPFPSFGTIFKSTTQHYIPTPLFPHPATTTILRLHHYFLRAKPFPSSHRLLRWQPQPFARIMDAAEAPELWLKYIKQKQLARRQCATSHRGRHIAAAPWTHPPLVSRSRFTV